MSHSGSPLRLPAMTIVVALASCHQQQAPQAPPKPPARQRVEPDPAVSLERLESRVVALQGAKTPLPSDVLASVVNALAISLQPVSHAGRLRMAKFAKRIRGVPVRSLAQGGLLKEALQELLSTLTSHRSFSGNQAEYHAALRELAGAREALDELLPLDQQRSALRRALEAAANAVFMVRGADAPFEPPTSRSVPDVPLGSFQQELAQARRDIGEAAATSLMGSRAKSAKALDSIADMVEAADSSGSARRQVSEIRFQSRRIQNAAVTELGRAEWVRDALLAAVVALSELSGETRSPWLDEAKRTIGRIDPHSQTSFQRAAIQDALRATVDAYAALGAAPAK